MSTTATLYPSADTYLKDTSPNSNYGTETVIRIGERNSGAEIGRGLLNFDLSSIPSGASVVSATLRLYRYADYSSNARTYRVYRVKRAWVETQATWNAYSTGNNWQTAGASGANDREGTEIGSRAMSASEAAGFKDFTLTPALVTEMLNGAFANNGFLVQADTESDDAYEFRSREHSTAGERPQLVIEYNPGGRQFQAVLVGL